MACGRPVSPSSGGAENPPYLETPGYDDSPEGYPTDQMPLFEGLNKCRGGWSFEESLSESDTATPPEGMMQIVGSSKDRMSPMWKLALRWPAEEPEQVISYAIIASPEASGFKLMLARIGPTKPEAGIAYHETGYW